MKISSYLAISFVSLTFTCNLMASPSEIDNEIDRLTVDVQSQKVSTGPKNTLNAATQPVQIKPQRQSQPEMTAKAPAHQKTDDNSLFYNFEILPFLSYSSFNGGDKGTVISNELSNPYTGTLSGEILTDLNFGSRNFVPEVGVMYLKTGSNLGGFSNNYTFIPNPTTLYSNNELITLQYIGVPLNIKWLINGVKKNSFFAKFGAAPMYLLSSAYTNFNGPSYIGYRYGNYSQFDILGMLSVGANFSVYRQFGVVVEGGYYQGTMPISNQFNLLNSGFIAGAGLTYSL